MLETKLFEVAIPAYEIEISEYIRSKTFNGGGSKMVIGIENQNKEVYRVLETTGMGDFMHTINFLADLGLTDILESETKAIAGYDARFRPEEISSLAQ